MLAAIWKKFPSELRIDRGTAPSGREWVERYPRNSKGAVIYEGTGEIHHLFLNQLFDPGNPLCYNAGASRGRRSCLVSAGDFSH
jgi:hypothetical protein